MEFLELVDSDTLQPRWRATMFERAVSSNWEWFRTVNSAEVLPSGLCYLYPEIYDDEKVNDPVLNKVISSSPTLDQCNEDVVNMIAKQNKPRDPNGWVTAGNTKSKKLEQVRAFSAERLYFHRSYLQCAFSKYLISKAPRNTLY